MKNIITKLVKIIVLNRVQCLEISVRVCVGQLGLWTRKVGYEFDPVVFVSPLKNN